MKKKRLSRGKVREGAIFPVAPGKADLPVNYSDLLQEIKIRVQQTRLRTVLTANATMVRLYWEIGHSILKRQEREGWGSRVIDRLSHDLCKAFPDMKGFSPTNLKYMRRFAEECPECTIGQQPADQLPWSPALNKLVVEYALRDLQKPIGVAQWETKLTRALPKELKSSLPSIEAIEAELQSEIGKDANEP